MEDPPAPVPPWAMSSPLSRRMLQRHSPHKRVWRPRAWGSHYSMRRKWFHEDAECHELRKKQLERSPKQGRLAALLAAGWLPCPLCFTFAYEGEPHGNVPH